jgi:hypothetical protein
MKQELRFCTGVEVRATGGNKIKGYAAVFNQESLDLGGFTEVVKPGAFARAIRTGQDVACLFNHDPSMILGRTSSSTLKLTEDSTGLDFECALPETPLAQMVRTAIERGDVHQCSFGFISQKDNWVQRSGGTLRELLDVDLLDVSPVTYPAYPQTSVSARNLWPVGIPAEVRSHRLNDIPLVQECYRFQPVDQALEDLRRAARARLARLQD